MSSDEHSARSRAKLFLRDRDSILRQKLSDTLLLPPWLWAASDGILVCIACMFMKSRMGSVVRARARARRLRNHSCTLYVLMFYKTSGHKELSS